MSDGLCTEKQPGSRRRCTKPYGHRGQHSCGPSVVDHWGGKLGRLKPPDRGLRPDRGLSETLRAKFRDTPGQQMLSMDDDDPGLIIYKED